MKNIKKLLAILLVCIICLCFAACGNDSNNTDSAIDSSDDAVIDNKTDTANTYKGIEMSDELYDFTVKIDGTVYTVPAQLSDFLNSGWKYSYDNPEETDVAGENFESDSFENENGSLRFSVINLSGNTRKFKNCKIGTLDYSFSEWNNCIIELAKGLILEKDKTTVQNVLDKWGEPTENRTSEYGTTLNYIKDKHIMYSIYFDETGSLVSFQTENWVAETSDITTNAEHPKYLDDYKTPTQLTDDFLSYTFKLQGALYTFPAPVSEFVKNGWEITAQAESVAAQQGISGGIRIRKNGCELTCDIRNYSDVQVSAEDTMITSFNWSTLYKDLDLELSGGIKFGMTEDDFKKAVNISDFERHIYESSGTINYDLTEYTHHAYFQFSKEGILESINFGKVTLE